MKYLIIILCFIFVSCQEFPKTYKKLVIINKKTEYYRGTPEYLIAFDDGSDLETKFGMYSKYNIGDTLCMEYYADMIIIINKSDSLYCNCKNTLDVKRSFELKK